MGGMNQLHKGLAAAAAAQIGAQNSTTLGANEIANELVLGDGSVQSG